MQFEPGHTVGIDLGTTFSEIAILNDEGNPITLPNDDGDELTASVILLAESGHVIVGPRRERAAFESPENVVERIKRYMGVPDFRRTFDGREISPEFISALILKKLKQDAERRIGPIGNAVVTVPYYFNDARRKATEDAGRIAGLNVIDIMNEPTAATLAYAWHEGSLGNPEVKMETPRKVLVYDLGGGTFDVTLVEYTPTHFRVMATDGDVQLGGVDWNDRLLDYCAEEFKKRHGVDPRESAQQIQIMRNDCDLAKIDLTDREETVVHVRFGDKAMDIPVTRKLFEELTADLLQRTSDTTMLVLEEAGVSPQDLEAVVLVGGSTLMPQVPRMLKELLQRDPYTGISPHTAVAQGAAIHAAILEAKYRGEESELAERIRRRLAIVQQENVNSHGLGIVALDPKSGKTINHVMIPRNSRIPIEVRRIFKTTKDDQERITVQVLEGDAPDPFACSLLGKCRIAELPQGLPKGSPVEVSYAFTSQGRVVVTARDKTTGREAQIEIERRGGLREEDVDSLKRLADQYKVE